ncbi:erythroblast NAD(P)(+)--arginine ADP-ribosyltransferase-like isoform X1 [Cygnus olor]|uniref:erythroblast NAD(P)(+)--arginine ADP-ribosyltransferase-like isoform X1 n=1 Tax=Cygnus olor TaxID=8869 RepID=UPI001ADE1EF4|nr:erythroblast NAD(P)(+)--arginine ADP-ribosyltransferase-like isoform X1 [Cygnus olor]
MGRRQGLKNTTAPRVLRTERSRGNNSLQVQGCWDRAGGGGPLGLQLGTGVLLRMEHLALGWLLLAGTLAGTSAAGSKQDLNASTEVAMDMAQNSFDDQYQGCRTRMEEELKEVNRTEFQNQTYAETWRSAVEKWQSQQGNSIYPTVLRKEQAVAVLAYTAGTGLYKQFNAAVREGGRSREYYLQSFHFKTLHFLLTEALRTLREAQDVQDCHTVYRGIKDIRFTAQLHQTVRFGQFASASLKKEVAQKFGNDTLFSVHTCYGVSIRNFSFYPDQDEVLIPPFEVFKVINFTRDRDGNFIHLRSHAVHSTYNCALLKEKRCKEQPCVFSPGRSSPREPPHLWGLLLVATALAAVGCL